MPRVQVHADRVAISIDPVRLASWLDAYVPSRPDEGVDTLLWTIPIQLKRRGNELRLVIEAAADQTPVNPGLIRVVALAHHIRQRLLHDRASIDDVARAEGLTPSYVTRALRITFLAPDIIANLISGRHDPELSARKLMADTRFAIDWQQQREAFSIVWRVLVPSKRWRPLHEHPDCVRTEALAETAVTLKSTRETIVVYPKKAGQTASLVCLVRRSITANPRKVRRKSVGLRNQSVVAVRFEFVAEGGSEQPMIYYSDLVCFLSP